MNKSPGERRVNVLQAIKGRMFGSTTKLVRLNKLIASKSGRCSRREADRFLQNGWIRVDGLSPEETMVLGRKVPSDTSFEFLPQALDEIFGAVTIMYNKPLGVVSAQPENESKIPAIKHLTAENMFSSSPRKKQREDCDLNPNRLSKLAVAGRLDINSTGLLLFTQSGRLAKQVIGPEHNMEKEYLVRVSEKRIRFQRRISISGQGKYAQRHPWSQS